VDERSSGKGYPAVVIVTGCFPIPSLSTDLGASARPHRSFPGAGRLVHWFLR